jgi:hypothetical protein
MMGNGDYYYRNTNSMMNRSDNMPPQPIMVKKGQDFTTSPLFSKAYQIFPVVATQSANEKEALNGWTVKKSLQADGSTQVDLISTESEDIRQSFIVKPGYKLYFIEMNLMDDKNGNDENRGDDIGVLVDQNGIVQ